VLAFPPDARPGSRAPHAWLEIGTERISTLDLFGRGLVVLAAGDASSWRCAVAELAAGGSEAPIRVRSVGRFLRDDDGGFAAAYGLADGGAVLVRPDGIVAARWTSAPADHRVALDEAVNATLGFAAGAATSPEEAAA
jgi:putative polyketide hydroxylase